MPGASRYQQGNEIVAQLLLLNSVTYPTLAANASSTTTLTVAGVQPYDLISWNMQNPPAHLTIDNMWVSANNTVSILWGTDSTGISTGSVAIVIDISRCENAQALPAGAAIPNNFQ